MATTAKTKTPKKKAAKQYAAPALSKGLDILELLSQESSGLSLKEIAEKLDRSPGEIFRMLVILRERDYVALEPNSESYVLTFKLFEVAHRQPRVKLLTNAALPEMRKLVYEIEQSCHLVIHHNGRGLVVAQQDSPADRGLSVRLGAESPLWESCSGHILLAYAQPETAAEMLGAMPSGQRRLVTQSKLTSLSRRVQGKGFERINSKQIQGVKDIGYPIFDYSGNVIAALVIPFLEHIDDSHHVNIEGAQKLLEKAASNISNALGYS